MIYLCKFQQKILFLFLFCITLENEPIGFNYKADLIRGILEFRYDQKNYTEKQFTLSYMHS